MMVIKAKFLFHVGPSSFWSCWHSTLDIFDPSCIFVFCNYYLYLAWFQFKVLYRCLKINTNSKPTTNHDAVLLKENRGWLEHWHQMQSLSMQSLSITLPWKCQTFNSLLRQSEKKSMCSRQCLRAKTKALLLNCILLCYSWCADPSSANAPGWLSSTLSEGRAIRARRGAHLTHSAKSCTKHQVYVHPSPSADSISGGLGPPGSSFHSFAYSTMPDLSVEHKDNPIDNLWDEVTVSSCLYRTST